ncbi:MAG TPA: hypothetical protein VFS87_07770, partial [Qipengyuania sp.]|nr:hypothetical protein [Qipengyuania sp.]
MVKLNVRRPLALASLAAVASIALLIPSGPPAAAQATPQAGTRAGGSLASFRTDEELRRFLLERREAQRRLSQSQYDSAGPYPPPPPPPAAPMAAQESVSVTGSRVANPSITNTQERGVDEG